MYPVFFNLCPVHQPPVAHVTKGPFKAAGYLQLLNALVTAATETLPIQSFNPAIDSILMQWPALRSFFTAM